MLRGASRLQLPSAASLKRPPVLSLTLTRRPAFPWLLARTNVNNTAKSTDLPKDDNTSNARQDMLNPSTGVVSLHALRTLGIQNGTNLIPSASKLAAVSGPTAPIQLSFAQKCKAYIQLTKPELSGLVAITSSATAALCMAPAINASWAGVGSLLVSSSFPLVLWSGIGTFLCAGGANAFNQSWEAEYDKVMNRTKHRPIPSGRLTRKSAVVAGSLFSLAGVSSLAYFTNPLTAGLGALNIALYLTYTWMKRKTEWNTLFGGIVGGLPPIMGAAAAGSLMHPAGWVMASVLFFWQFPHFMAIAKIYREDYKRAGFRMVQDPQKMGIISLASCAALVAISAATYPLHLAHFHFFYISTILNGWYTWSSWKFYRNPTPNAKSLLRHSVVIQMLLCVLVMLAVNLTNENGDKYCLYDIAVAKNTVSATTAAPSTPSQ